MVYALLKAGTLRPLNWWHFGEGLVSGINRTRAWLITCVITVTDTLISADLGNDLPLVSRPGSTTGYRQSLVGIQEAVWQKRLGFRSASCGLWANPVHFCFVGTMGSEPFVFFNVCFVIIFLPLEKN